MRVEAKDIPIMQRFMTEFWKTIKDFYQVDESDEYSEDVCKRLTDLYEIYPDPLAKKLVLGFFRYVDHAQRKMRKSRKASGVKI